MSQSRCMATHQSAFNSVPATISDSMPADPPLAAGSAPEASTTSTHTPTLTNSLAPDDPLHTVQYISDNAWPFTLILNQSKSNWEDWSLHLTLITNEKGFTDWLHGFYPQPNATTDPKANHVWLINDHSLKAFMLRTTRLSPISSPSLPSSMPSASIMKTLVFILRSCLCKKH